MDLKKGSSLYHAFKSKPLESNKSLLDTYQLVHYMVEANSALCVPGNHEVKLVRKLRGRDVVVNYGLEQDARRDRTLAGRPAGMLLS